MTQLEIEILRLLQERGPMTGYQIDRALLRGGICEFPLNALHDLRSRGLVEVNQAFEISETGRRALASLSDRSSA